MGEFPEAHGPASLMHAIISSKVETGIQAHTVVCTTPHRHTHPHTTFKNQNFTVWQFLADIIARLTERPADGHRAHHLPSHSAHQHQDHRALAMLLSVELTPSKSSVCPYGTAVR